MGCWSNRRALLGNADQSCQDLKKGCSVAVGKTSGVRAWLAANCHHLLDGVGSVFLFCACEVLGTVKFIFVFAVAKYIIIFCF